MQVAPMTGVIQGGGAKLFRDLRMGQKVGFEFTQRGKDYVLISMK